MRKILHYSTFQMNYLAVEALAFFEINFFPHVLVSFPVLRQLKQIGRTTENCSYNVDI